MAGILSPTSTRLKPPFLAYFHSNPSPPSISSPFHHHLHRPSLPSFRTTPHQQRLRPCLVATPGPPQFDPPPENDSSLIKGFSRIQDRVRIFLAVLFWMSLFFWASVWDKSNGGPKKGSRFRR
ncbi:hypothetical protein QYF36_008034 [Acer negundo]|nr:hypothetical protein QYF36_008034 [Acer negundo]